MSVCLITFTSCNLTAAALPFFHLLFMILSSFEFTTTVGDYLTTHRLAVFTVSGISFLS